MSGVGAKRPKLMLVLEAPDWVDDKSGKIMSNDTGKKIRYYLQKAKIPKSEVWITYAVKCKPDCKPSEIKKTEYEQCRKHLVGEISKRLPKVILPMGKVPILSLTGFTSIDEYRGHFQDFTIKYKHTIAEETTMREHKAHILPTYSPTSALSKWEYDDYIIHDLKKAYALATTKKLPKTPEPKYEVIDSLKKLKKWEEEMKKYIGKPVIQDFETTSLDFTRGKVINSGYSVKKDHAYIIYLLDEWPDSHMKKFSDEDKERAKKLVKFYTENREEVDATVRRVHSSGIIFVGHNHKFDRKYAMKWGYPMTNCLYDTVVMDALNDENKRHALNIVMEYFGINYGPYDTELYPYVNKDRKNKKPYTYAPPSLLDRYLSIDVAGCRRLFFKLFERLKKQKLLKLYKVQQRPLLDELVEMEYHGFFMDIELMKSDAERIGKEIDGIVNKLKKIAKSETFNPNSVQQLANLMTHKGYPFEKLKIKKGKLGYSVGEDSLKKFLKFKKWRRIPDLVLRLRKLRKLKSTYIINDDGKKGILPKVDENGYLHCDFNAHTPRTGRLSSSDPNFQNIPAPSKIVNIRNYFIPPHDDWCTWEADYSALEMKVVAHMAQDPVMIEQLQKGVDMHSQNAVNFGHVLGFVDKKIDYEEFKLIAKFDEEDAEKYLEKYGQERLEEIRKLHPEFDKLRKFAKSVGFGLNYGIEPETLAEDHGVPVEDVLLAIDTYFSSYRYLKKFRAKCCDESITKGRLVLPTGRVRRFTQFADWINHSLSQDTRKRKFDIAEVHRQAMNFPVQGYANEIYTRGKLKLIKRLRAEGLKSKVLITIHDGVVGIGPISEMQRVKEICHEEMTTMLGKGKNQLKLNIDFNCNERWYGKQITNFDVDDSQVA